MSKPLVSVVIPCYNSIDIVDSCLRTLLRTTYPNYEVVIVDDYSQDGTYEHLIKKYSSRKKIRILRNEKNSKASVTRNNGIKASYGKYVAFIETDMEVEPGWLEPMVSEMEKDKKLGAVQSQVLDTNRKDKYHSIGVKYNPHTFWVLSPQCGLDKTYQPKEVSLGIGSVGSMMRKDVLDRVGYYDETIMHNIDDIELGWRIWLAGYTVKPVYDSVTYHWTAKPQSTRTKVTPSIDSEFYFHKGARIFIKNYELENLLIYLPWQCFAYTIRIVKNLFIGNTTPLQGAMKACVWNVQTFPSALRERKRIQSFRKRTDQEMFELLGIRSNFFTFIFRDVPRNLQWVQEVFANTQYKKEEKAKKEECIVCGYHFYKDESPCVVVNGQYYYKTCPVCRGGTLLPKPSDATLTKAYATDTYYEGLSKPSRNPLVQWAITRRLYREPYEWVLKKFKKGRVLDVGPGNGEFLYALKQKGWTVFGSDISKKAKERTEKRIGKGVVKLGSFPDQRFSPMFDLVSFWHVLEHTRTPRDYIYKAADVLKKGGHIAGEVPSYDSRALKFFGKNYAWMMVPVHIGYFSEGSLRKLLSESGFVDIVIYSPPRALTNYALSFKNWLTEKSVPNMLSTTLYIVSIPISVIATLIAASSGKGEVLRFSATKGS